MTISGAEHDPQLKDRVGRLMQFLRELVASRSTPVLDLARHHEHYWLAAAADLCHIEPHAEPGQILLRAPRITLDPPPEIPPSLRGWLSIVDVGNSAVSRPPLNDRGPHPDDRTTVVALVDAPSVDTTYNSWIPAWNQWAAIDRERRPRHNLYESLTRMRQSLIDQPESMEVVVAGGLLELPAGASAPRIRTHLVAQAAVITQDAETGDLLCILADESSPRLEDSQLLTGHPSFDPSGTAHLRDRLRELAATPLDPGLLTFLKEWSQRACATSVEVGDDDAALGTSSLSPAPALVLRRRGAFALLEYYDQMITASERPDAPVPLGIAQLVSAIEPGDRLDWLERTGAAAAVDLSLDPLFPLPANEEQRQIIHRLGHDSGVVVEGPPGTGKTHTIANLMSTLLASGQRILVTSEKAQALRVLRDKLPDELQELCVSITDVGRGGSTELNRSVASLAARKASFNPDADDRQISELTERREQVRRRRAATLEDIRALRESETFEHPEVSQRFSGTRAAIAKLVTSGRSEHEWISGPLHGAAPLTSAELAELVQLLIDTDDQRRSRAVQVITPAEARPPLDDVVRLCDRARRGGGAETATDSRLHAVVEAGLDLPGLVSSLTSLEACLGDLDSTSDWAPALADRVLSGRDGYLWERAAGVRDLVEAARVADQALGTSRVEGLPDTSPAAHLAFTNLATYLASGGAIKKRFKSDQQKAVDAWLPTVTVGAQPITSATQAQLVRAHLDVYARARDVADLLAPLGADVTTTGDRSALVGHLVEVARSIDAITRLVSVIVATRPSLAPGRIQLGHVEEARSVAEEGARLLAAHDGRVARAELARLADHVRVDVDTPPEAEDLASALRAADEHAVEAALRGLAHADVQLRDQTRCDDLSSRLALQAPQLHDSLAASATDPAWITRATRWDEAWAWGVAAHWLAEQSDPGRDERLNNDLAQLEAELGHVTAKLGAARAWHAAMHRMTASQVQALQSYRDNLANVGMGTGKYAERFRQAARSAMQEAQGAVPAWVMPLQQVLASIPAEQNTFDVVIVDEASQADITSLFLMWLAPRVIVVGDDKQCTPSEVSAGALDKVFERLDSYLHDVPVHLRDTLTPRSSVFSMLRTRFGQVVRLREHFRCMPEIITWSSQMFYRDAPLVPVRQFGADRLPPLRSTYVPGAPSEGSSARLHNLAEAEAIIEAVEQCLVDPAYDDKTFGIVVLQGQAQVDVIRNELIKRIPSDVLEERRLRVGTPPDFQGDERHVVMLSMVVGAEKKPMAMTKLEYQRRFNVAASRAQDQLWLFHSVTADLLSPSDLRKSLLTYVQTTRDGAAEPMPSGVTRDDKHVDFDSLFEQRVFLDLVERGYHVTPQVEVNSRRLDLVVTGRGSKLAVECDGDFWHSTPEQVRADLDREVELRRCGWTFWRVRESEYYLDRDRALSSLWIALDDLGIGPFQGDPSTPIDIAGEVPAPWTPTQLPTDDDSPVEDDDSALVHVSPPPTPRGPVGTVAAPSDSDQPPPVPVDSLATPVDIDAVREESGEMEAARRGYHRVDHTADDALKDQILQLAAGGGVSNGDVRTATGLTSERARDLLQQLVTSGRMTRTGAKRGTRYHVVSEIAPTANDPRTHQPRVDESGRPHQLPTVAVAQDAIAAVVSDIAQWTAALEVGDIAVLEHRVLRATPPPLGESAAVLGLPSDAVASRESRLLDELVELSDTGQAGEVLSVLAISLGDGVSTLDLPLRSGPSLTRPERLLLLLAGYFVEGDRVVRADG